MDFSVAFIFPPGRLRNVPLQPSIQFCKLLLIIGARKVFHNTGYGRPDSLSSFNVRINYCL